MGLVCLSGTKNARIVSGDSVCLENGSNWTVQELWLSFKIKL